MQILDEQHIVAFLVVNELIHELLCLQKSEATWPKTFGFASWDETEEVVGRAIDGSVAEFFQRKALTGVLDAADDCLAGANDRDFHVLASVEMAAMFHGVQKDFAAGGGHAFPFCFRNAGVFGSAKELH